ncbi:MULTISPECIES: hypothetical protein [Rhizobium]|jgi:hypothetical protein|uniref:hypothetical protein n=1 Tax=Rhizobium TaxID=379 RepID=UPI000646614D|nr:hypothetical protein [Rhizobium lusitanum]NTJ09394.1 hypothetical protein [Rhizobium lusitanum]
MFSGFLQIDRLFLCASQQTFRIFLGGLSVGSAQSGIMAFSIDGVPHRFHEIASLADVMKAYQPSERRQRDEFEDHHAAFYIAEGGDGSRSCTAEAIALGSEHWLVPSWVVCMKQFANNRCSGIDRYQ